MQHTRSLTNVVAGRPCPWQGYASHRHGCNTMQYSSMWKAASGCGTALICLLACMHCSVQGIRGAGQLASRGCAEHSKLRSPSMLSWGVCADSERDRGSRARGCAAAGVAHRPAGLGVRGPAHAQVRLPCTWARQGGTLHVPESRDRAGCA